MGQNRQPPGISTGGQYATKTYAEADISLTSESGDPFAWGDGIEWEDLGIGADEVGRWVDAGVSWPEVAVRCQESGITPDLAAHPWKTFDARGGPPESISIGRAIQSGIIEDDDIRAVSDWIRNRSKAHAAAQSGDQRKHRAYMSLAAQARRDIQARGVEVPGFVGRPQRS